MTSLPDGLSLAPFRALRPTVGPSRLGRLLCPPYDVISDDLRRDLLAADPDNAVSVILPRSPDGADPYRQAAKRLDEWVSTGLYAPDKDPALYVYEMRAADGAVTRGLVGAVQLRDPAEGVILPHENTMAGPVADRLALMAATEANLEPIYLVYDGGGVASEVVRDVADDAAVATARTPDGIAHRLWSISRPGLHAEIEADLAHRRALIADGHHRYATYRELQRRLDGDRGAGAWDRGLALLVDTSSYGPQVHAIHRVLTGLPFDEAVMRTERVARTRPVDEPAATLAYLTDTPGFAAVLTDGGRCAVVTEPDPDLVRRALDRDEPVALAGLDVIVLHRVFIDHVWHLADTEDVVGYAHSVDDAIADARRRHGTAVLLRPTPVAAVAAVAAAGARMPRKSTFFTPKPASGLVMRRFRDLP